MDFDIFFSISQTPVGDRLPSEAQMFRSFFEQVRAADELGFGVGWVAESHLSSEVQKSHKAPVIPHWKGEVGLNVDITQLAQAMFACTQRLEVGSAVMNIVCNGGPVAAAERIAYWATLAGFDPKQRRRLHVGFSAGRFEFMNRAYGVQARDAFEEAAWPVLKGKVFTEATEIFLRLLRGDTLASDDVGETVLRRQDFRTDADWAKVVAAHGKDAGIIPARRRWSFERLKIVPQQWRRELVQPVIGSHDPAVQSFANTLLPTHVFNLSITSPAIIEETHQRMTQDFHPRGGGWKRSYMPRTVFVFVNEEPGLSPQSRSEHAQEEARLALGAYWTALEGTLDPGKVRNAADNALIGNAEQIAGEIVERFHPDDRLMLWFDFFNHDSERVTRNMRAFTEQVAPRVRQLLAEKTS